MSLSWLSHGSLLRAFPADNCEARSDPEQIMLLFLLYASNLKTLVEPLDNPYILGSIIVNATAGWWLAENIKMSSLPAALE